MTGRRGLHEGSEAQLDQVRMEDQLTRLVGLYRAGPGADGDGPMAVLAYHVLSP